VRQQVAQIVGQGEQVPTGQIPFTPRAKKVLELALREALSLGHNHIGTEHLLLGLARENEGVASRILLDLGVDAEQIRTAVSETIGGPMPRPTPMVRLRGKRRSRGRAFGPAVFAREMLVVGWLLFGVSLGLGVLVGWLIWG
jgi:ATP-dependent Clp protease ATP-binding subunit ClpA